MAGSQVSLAEQRMAKQLLRSLGLTSSRQLGVENVLAMVAWMRVVRNTTGSRFHNLLGIGPQSFGTGYVKPHLKTYRGKDGNRYYRFASVAQAIKVSIRLMKLQAKRSGSPMAFALRSLKGGRGQDFLIMLALSEWSYGHYGLPTNPTLAQAQSALNKLLKMRGQLKSLAQLIRKVIKRTPKAQFVAQRPKMLPPPALPHPYYEGFAAARFYAARDRATLTP